MSSGTKSLKFLCPRFYQMPITAGPVSRHLNALLIILLIISILNVNSAESGEVTVTQFNIMQESDSWLGQLEVRRTGRSKDMLTYLMTFTSTVGEWGKIHVNVWVLTVKSFSQVRYPNTNALIARRTALTRASCFSRRHICLRRWRFSDSWLWKETKGDVLLKKDLLLMVCAKRKLHF